MEVIGQRFAEFDRREFVKLTGAAGAFALLGKNALGAECSESRGTGLQFWLDGLHFEGGPSGSDIISNATLALFSYDHSMTAESSVESVSLIDSTNNAPLAIKFFRNSHKTSTGKAPYVVFENITLSYAGRYLVRYIVKSGEKIMVHTYELAKATRTTFANPQVRVPLSVKQELSSSGGMEQALKATPEYIGTITSPYLYYTQNGLSQHSARSVIKDISATGKFTIDISPMHADLSGTHFMKFFIVADPVGRLLGLIWREVATVGSLAPTQSVYWLGQKDSFDSIAQRDIINNTLSQLERKKELSFPKDTWSAEKDIANINDCPYIQIITDDGYDAIARQVVRLR